MNFCNRYHPLHSIQRSWPLVVLAFFAGCDAPSADELAVDGDSTVFVETTETVNQAPTPRLLPRAALQSALNLVDDALPHRLVVKFRDDVQARAQRGFVRLARGQSDLVRVVDQHRLGFTQLVPLADAELRALEERAAKNSGIAQPDLASMMIVSAPKSDTATLRRVRDQLSALPEVEFAWLERLGVPPPGDIAPTTPSYVSQQTYRGSSIGINIDAAWTAGARGGGVRLSDVEYGWNPNHEDLNEISLHPEPGQTPAPDVVTNGWDEHGTAVVGVTSGLVNSYGVSGLVPDATVYTFSEWTVESGFRRAAAISAAVAGSAAGDVVLLEMQAGGPTGAYVPAEYDPSIWTIVKNATDAGVIVVAAAGNGGADLDSADFAEYRGRGDSGAIIVGAGSASAQHDRLGFSTYGARVNVQGWGDGVVTTGYGSLAEIGGDKNQRYSFFNGTSSASPIVASAAVALQSAAPSRIGRRLTPNEMRTLLINTGTPQGSGVSGHIGPLPNLANALASLGTGNQAPTVTFTAPAQGATVSGVVTITATATDSDGSIAKVVFTLPDGTSVEDNTFPYSVTWSSTTVANGAHTIGVRAHDNLGALSPLANRNITVNNASSCINGTFAATDVPQNIPDSNQSGITSNLPIAGNGKVATLALTLRVNHPYKGDLKITLIGPDNTQVVVHNRSGGSADNVIFNALPISSFNNKVAAGTWRLRVQDLGPSDVGTLQSWSLNIVASCP